MPRRSSKRTAVKKMWKRKPRRKQVNVNRSLQPLSQRYICSLKYTQTFTLNSSATTQAFRLNSLYRPNITTTADTSQPYGFDQLSALYNRYRVVSCSYSMVGINSDPIRLIAIPANTTVSPSDPSNAMENPRSKWVIQLPGGNTKTLKGKVYIPSVVGRTRAQYMADDRYQADIDSNPLELVALNIYHGNLTDSSYPQGNTNVVITLKYTVEFFDVKVQSQS